MQLSEDLTINVTRAFIIFAPLLADEQEDPQQQAETEENSRLANRDHKLRQKQRQRKVHPEATSPAGKIWQNLVGLSTSGSREGTGPEVLRIPSDRKYRPENNVD